MAACALSAQRCTPPAGAGPATPAAETEFARDKAFGYSSSFLPDYVAEKTRASPPARALFVC